MNANYRIPLLHALLLCIAAGIGLGWLWRGEVERRVTRRAKEEEAR